MTEILKVKGGVAKERWCQRRLCSGNPLWLPRAKGYFTGMVLHLTNRQQNSNANSRPYSHRHFDASQHSIFKLRSLFYEEPLCTQVSLQLVVRTKSPKHLHFLIIIWHLSVTLVSLYPRRRGTVTGSPPSPLPVQKKSAVGPR